MMVLWWRFKVATKNWILYAASVLRLKRFPTLLYFTMSHTDWLPPVIPGGPQQGPVCSLQQAITTAAHHFSFPLPLPKHTLHLFEQERTIYLSIYPEIVSNICLLSFPCLSPSHHYLQSEQCNVSSIISRLVYSSVWWLCVLLHNMMMMAVMVIVWRWESLLSRLQRARGREGNCPEF